MAPGNPKRKATDRTLEEEEEEEEEKICRFCFDGEEEDSSNQLISPCHCRGGQKYIHLSCLRQWQRMVLVSQPTHPDFWEEDERHVTCNVCKAEFSCPPPTRKEMMEGFTGPEIAALIEPGCIIASHSSFNRRVQEQINDYPFLAHLASVQHWLRGVYLITKVQEDTGDIEYPLEDERDVNRLFQRLNKDDTSGRFYLELADGKKYELQAEGPLEEHDTIAHMTEKDLRSLLTRQATLSCHLIFRHAGPLVENDCKDDKVAAVNLTRPFQPKGPLKAKVGKIIQEVKASQVNVTYYLGGPCEDDRIVTCLVLGGRRTGYTVVNSFRQALLMAKRNALHAKKEERKNIAVGQDVILQGLLKRPDLNGKRALVQAYDESQGRFQVRLLETQTSQDTGNNTTTGAGEPTSLAVGTTAAGVGNSIKRVKPDNLVANSSRIGQNGTVLAFLGDARWTRVQLLGEIAKTSWGLCRAQTLDLFRPASELYDSVFSRLVYAPDSEMNADSGGDEDNMVALRRGAVEAARYAQGGNDI